VVDRKFSWRRWLKRRSTRCKITGRNPFFIPIFERENSTSITTLLLLLCAHLGASPLVGCNKGCCYGLLILGDVGIRRFVLQLLIYWTCGALYYVLIAHCTLMRIVSLCFFFLEVFFSFLIYCLSDGLLISISYCKLGEAGVSCRSAF
jgi:hypothetical protein